MKLTVWSVASIAALALVACARKENATAETDAPTPEEMTATTAEDDAAEAADVYAASAVDLASVRTREALTAASDAAFAQADTDGDGILSQTEFYSLPALLAPAADPMAEGLEEPPVDSAPGADLVAGAGSDPVDGIIAEEPTADTTELDAGYATIAGADSTLTTEDLRAALQARFDAADVNLDGTLDDAEAATFMAAKLF